MDSHFLLVLLLSGLVVGLGAVYRRFRSRDLPEIPDEQFVRDFLARHPIRVAPEAILSERRHVARVLGIAPEKLAVTHTVDFLSARLSYLADFSVAWNDLADEAEEMRQEAGLERRKRPVSTLGELLEDRLRTG